LDVTSLAPAPRWRALGREKRLPLLQAFFETHDRLANADYRELFNVTRFAAIGDLRRLTEEGFLTLEGERRGAFYRPGYLLKVE
jgi:hypothetical protein